MRILGIACAAIALTGCTSSTSHTLSVEGEPEAVARFVRAEQDRAGVSPVGYRSGDSRAKFSSPTANAHSGMARRAIAAQLTLRETSRTSWSVGGVPGGSNTTAGDPGR